MMQSIGTWCSALLDKWKTFLEIFDSEFAVWYYWTCWVRVSPIGLVGFEWAIAVMIACSLMLSEIELMLNSPHSICVEHSLNLKGPMCSETGPLMKRVSVALEKCSWQHFITYRQEDSAQNHHQPTPNAKWERTRESNHTSMHFQEATASLLLSERRWPCKQFEITQLKGAWTTSWYRNGGNPAADFRSHLWC